MNDQPPLASAPGNGVNKEARLDGLVLYIAAEKPLVGSCEPFLVEQGLRLQKTSGGEEGVAIYGSLRPDLVLIDVNLNDMSGYEACRRIKANKNIFTPVIIVSPDGESQDKSEGFEAGCDDFLTNPGERRELLARLRSMIRMKRQHDDILELSLVDELTALRNRRYLSEIISIEFEKARRYGEHLSTVMVDLDHFKRVNDSLGHPAGDEVLKAVSRFLEKNTRGADYLIRYGGEEFLIILPYTTSSSAYLQAERTRKYIKNHPIQVDGHTIHITASFGIATYPTARSIQSMEDLIKASDMALYEAKQQGRDRCVIDPDSVDGRIKRILVVDDDPTIRRLIVSSLRDYGYQPGEAQDAEDAEAFIKENPPDLILLDIMMPKLDGLTFCRRLKTNPAFCNIPILIVSAKDEVDDRVRGLEFGAEDYITKPFSARELLARVDKILSRQLRD